MASFEDDIEDVKKLGRHHGTKLNTGLCMPGLGSLSSTGGKTGEARSFTHGASGVSKGRRRGTRLITPPAEKRDCSAASREEACWDVSKEEMLRKLGEWDANDKCSRNWRQIL